MVYRSDLHGQIAAQMTEDVYDSLAGKLSLFPQRTRLMGQYGSRIAFWADETSLGVGLIKQHGRSTATSRPPARRGSNLSSA